MDLTPDILAAAYRLLHVAPPFRDWNLPEADELTFKVTRATKHFARVLLFGDGRRHVEVSRNAISSLAMLLPYMGHEMVHLHLKEIGLDTRGGPGTHSGAFRVLFAEACAIHNWDRKAYI